MILSIPRFFRGYNFRLSEYILKEISENAKILTISRVSDIFLTGYNINFKLSELKFKIYKYKKINELIKDYFSSDVSGVLFLNKDGYFGLNVFTFKKFLSSEEFYLYEFHKFNERVVDMSKFLEILGSLTEVDISYFERYSINKDLILEIENSYIDCIVVNIIDKFYNNGYIFPFFDIHLYEITGGISSVKNYYLFTRHPNISRDGRVCFGKKKASIYNLSNLDMNFSSAYNTGIKYTSWTFTKELIKKIIEGGGLDV